MNEKNTPQKKQKRKKNKQKTPKNKQKTKTNPVRTPFQGVNTRQRRKGGNSCISQGKQGCFP